MKQNLVGLLCIVLNVGILSAQDDSNQKPLFNGWLIFESNMNMESEYDSELFDIMELRDRTSTVRYFIDSTNSVYSTSETNGIKSYESYCDPTSSFVNFAGSGKTSEFSNMPKENVIYSMTESISELNGIKAQKYIGKSKDNPGATYEIWVSIETPLD